jgi:hypothetical protein
MLCVPVASVRDTAEPTSVDCAGAIDVGEANTPNVSVAIR